jgi:hypothetical protein
MKLIRKKVSLEALSCPETKSLTPKSIKNSISKSKKMAV